MEGCDENRGVERAGPHRQIACVGKRDTAPHPRKGCSHEGRGEIDRDDIIVVSEGDRVPPIAAPQVQNAATLGHAFGDPVGHLFPWPPASAGVRGSDRLPRRALRFRHGQGPPACAKSIHPSAARDAADDSLHPVRLIDPADWVAFV